MPRDAAIWQKEDRSHINKSGNNAGFKILFKTLFMNWTYLLERYTQCVLMTPVTYGHQKEIHLDK